MPVDERGDFPITPGLLFACAVAFGLFNQWLLWGLALASRLTGRNALIGWGFWGSLAMGLAVWLAVALAAVAWRTQRSRDIVLAGLAIAAGGVSVQLGSALPWASANTALVLWHARGLRRHSR